MPTSSALQRLLPFLALVASACTERSTEGAASALPAAPAASASPSATASTSTGSSPAGAPAEAPPTTPGQAAAAPAFPVIHQGVAQPSAKRVPPRPIDPITERGVRYVVPHFASESAGMAHNGGYLEALDAGTNRRIWLKEIYRYAIRSDRETDVQDVFVTSMRLDNNALRLTDEKGGDYLVPLATK